MGPDGTPWITFYFDKPSRPANSAWHNTSRSASSGRNGKSRKGFATYAGVRGSKDSFYEKVAEHLRKIVHTIAPPTALDDAAATGRRDGLPAGPADKTSFIDIRGLQVGTGKAHRFPIEELYISLTTTRRPRRGGTGERRRPRRGKLPQRPRATRGSVPLHQAMQNDRLVVIGDPGAGKTTFLRRVAHALCQTQLGEVPERPPKRLGIPDRTFPVFVRLSELAAAPAPPAAATATHRRRRTRRPGCRTTWPRPARQRLGTGRGLLPRTAGRRAAAPCCWTAWTKRRTGVLRERLSRLIENATGTTAVAGSWSPAGRRRTRARSVLPDFAHARIDPLSDEAVETFLSRWCEALYVESREAAQEHCRELLAALRGRPEIRRMARNPVMLTALAVVHWNERRLPEQRADLYESIIHWLSRSREQRPGRGHGGPDGRAAAGIGAGHAGRSARPQDAGPQTLGGREDSRPSRRRARWTRTRSQAPNGSWTRRKWTAASSSDAATTCASGT